ncbi:MAG: hypothetical protein JNK53_04520, partial [Phycisphaerae bacterium]|nr:hypothetical protein [Phycisphaerae bacterium]
LLVNGTSSFGGGAVTTTGSMNIAGPSTFTADTTLTSGGLLTLGANANAGAFDLSLAGPAIRFAHGVTVTGDDLTFTGPMVGLGSLTMNAAGTLSLMGDLDASAGHLELGTPSLLVLGGSIDSLDPLFFRSDIRVQGTRTVTVRGVGDAIFEGTVNGTTFEADSLFVNSAGLTAFQKDVGNTMRMLRLETNPPGTIQVAPLANAVFVVYGELGPFGPTDGGGGVALAQSYSSMWDEAVRPFIEGRKMGQVDYRRSLNTLLTADLDAGFAPGGFAATTTEEE